MSKLVECIFCQIIAAERHAIMIAQSPLTVAFLDIQPVNLGHALIVPQRHVSSFTELTEPEVSDLMIVAQKVAKALRETFTEHDGITLSLADGLSAGQDVPHTHLHVIPRQPADGFGWRRLGVRSDREELEQIGQQIRLSIGG